MSEVIDTPLAAWSGEIGDAYFRRHLIDELVVAQRERMWRAIGLRGINDLVVMEVGAGAGENLIALRRHGNYQQMLAAEPNSLARECLVRNVDDIHLIGDALPYIGLPMHSADLVFTCGVLIHMPPDQLDDALREVHRLAKRYILAVEYFSDRPEMIPWRGMPDLLWKRDFGRDYMRLFSDLVPVSAGFFWRETTGLDNVTWWLFEK